jgi:tRNA-specific 2-thiouridylase
MAKNKLVVVGMSGGVDSSVSAYLLKRQGYNVVGLFMKNWEEVDDCGCCTAESDFNDVKRVCEKIGIPYYTVNFAKEYVDRVFAHFLDGLKRGITPNPDVLCNREIKFGPFLEFANKIGADYIATGHYAGVERTDGITKLLRASDDTKDQSYFLCALSQKQLEKVLFPLADLHKTEVRKIAREIDLAVHDKPDSTGICFIGERKFAEFMKSHIGKNAGDIKTLDGRVVGRHDGLAFYTIGQRKGLKLGAISGIATGDIDRWFVVKKDTETNTLYVNNGECDELFTTTLFAEKFNWITPPNGAQITCTAKTRYRQPDQECAVRVSGDGIRVVFMEKQRAVTAGQWVVLYDGNVCLGGGEITKVGE